MRNILKKLFMLCIVGCLVAVAMCFVACGDRHDNDDGPDYTEGLAYALNEDGQSYCVYNWGSANATAGILKIPATYNGKPVTAIADSAFTVADRENINPDRYIQELVLPDSITKIGNSAFYQAGVDRINLPSSVKTIGSNAFYRCGIHSIDLPEGLTRIEESTFSDCEYLEHITLPSTLTEIGANAFQRCYKLKEPTFPSGLQTIGKEAFFNCNGLINPVLPDSVTSIGDRAFEACYEMKSIKLPANLTRIELGAFDTCEKLEKISIPQSVEYIGKFAFNNCLSLTEFKFPQKVTVISEEVLGDCVSLVSITIPEGITEIEDGAFIGCDKLVEVYNYSDLEIEAGSQANGHVAYNALNVCTGEANKKLHSNSNGFVFYTDDEHNYLMAYKGENSQMTLPSASSYEIYKYAFAYNNIIKSAYIPSGITVIPERTFEGCENLESVNLPDSLTAINELAFFGSGIKSITLPASVSYLGEDILGWTAVESVTFNDTESWYVKQSKWDNDKQANVTTYIAVDVTDAEQNAVNLNSNGLYADRILVKNPELDAQD